MAVTSVCPSANSHSGANTDDSAVAYSYFAAANGDAAPTPNTNGDAAPTPNGYTAANGNTITDSDGNSTSYSFAY